MFYPVVFLIVPLFTWFFSDKPILDSYNERFLGVSGLFRSQTKFLHNIAKWPILQFHYIVNFASGVCFGR